MEPPLEQQAPRIVEIIRVMPQKEAAQKIWQELEEEMLSLAKTLDAQSLLYMIYLTMYITGGGEPATPSTRARTSIILKRQMLWTY